MLEEMKGSLVDAVKSATAVLNDEDALAILEICRLASEREIANVTERYLMEQVEERGAGE